MEQITRSFERLQIRPKDRLILWAKSEFNRKALAQSLSAGLLLYVLEAILAVSFGALVFGGPLAGFLPLAIALVLIGDAILVLTVSLMSSYPGSIAVEQDTPAVILVVAVAGLVAGLQALVRPDELFATVLVLVLGTTLLAGLAFMLVGLFRLGGLVRFLPYPVMGGFLAGTGWLLATGGVGVMQDLSLGLSIFESGRLLSWVPGAVAGVLMAFLVRRWPSPLTLLLSFAAVLALFYGVTVVFQVPIERLYAGGWLLGPFPDSVGWRFPFSASLLSQVRWGAVLGALPQALPAILIGMISMLLNASSMELVIKKDLNIDREMVTAGIGNLLAGLGGGLIGYHAISLTSLNHTMTKGKRLPGLVVAGLLLLTVLFGTALLSFVPRILLGALLIYIGVELLYEWVVEVWAKFPRVDALIVMIILVTIGLTNFLWGILVGTILTVLLFVVSYSRVNLVRYTLTGTTYHSRFYRQLEHTRLLERFGDQILIFKLEGFIFFGTANDLYEQVHQRIRQPGKIPVRYVILDFEMVSGMDSTGLLSFSKMLQFTQDRNVALIFSGLKGRALKQFENGGFGAHIDGLHLFSQLDRAVEWCEDRILLAHGFALDEPAVPLAERLAAALMAADTASLMGYLERTEVAAGELLMRQDDPPDDVYLIESGRITVTMELGGGDAVRLLTMGAGSVVGQEELYLGTSRTASAVAETASTVYRLSAGALHRMETDAPALAIALHHFMARALTERLAAIHRTLRSLSR